MALDGAYILDPIRSGPTNDVLITAKFRTYDAGGGASGIFHAGQLNLLSGFSGSSSINTGDVFRLVWFEGEDDSLRCDTLSDASFTIPADGVIQDYTAPVVGVDPVRSVGNSCTRTAILRSRSSSLELLSHPPRFPVLLRYLVSFIDAAARCNGAWILSHSELGILRPFSIH